MFDSEGALICLNALYYEEVMDYILALTCQTKKSSTFAIKAPNLITQKQGYTTG